jgi:hypothetical protein
VKSHPEKSKENKNQSWANNLSKKKNGEEPALPFADNRPETVAQRKLNEIVKNSPQVSQLKAFQEMADSSSTHLKPPSQKKKTTKVCRIT